MQIIWIVTNIKDDLLISSSEVELLYFWELTYSTFGS